MATTIVDKSACELAGQGQEGGLLPINPFTALQFHFGMLLGVDDLDAGQGYPRGKIRLHNAWLHREGVVWGFDVAFNDRNELTVDRGLALDAAGHELHLDRLACVDVGEWYKAHKDDTTFTFADTGDGGKTFSVHVVARFKACLARPVPSIVEPCAGVENDTAYSRVFETVELLLRPGLSTPKDLGYHRLRVLFQIEPDSAPYADVKTARDSIQALPADQQPVAYLDALRRFAALDEIDLHPQAATYDEPASIVPEDPTDVVLADVADIIVKPTTDDGWAIVTPTPTPVVTVRRSHIATATIQELLCGPLFTAVSGPAPKAPPPRARAAAATNGGPTVSDAKFSPKSITLQTSRPLAKASVEPAAFSVTEYDDKAGWSVVHIKAVARQADGTIKIDLKESASAGLVRLIARGTGPAPLLAENDRAPLGAPGAGGPDDGSDFVTMFRKTRS
ncbi:MAG: hypothetical protein LAO77_12845 [Acidobacteriia bacterium]|nr:hypothetical protein [Terriglobia bacterium]